ncbi:MAG: LptF/LptG family permease [bacterium]|nr:LptF/LptG family permease [bacterium]
MKRLYFFSIRSFAGPFLATFAISMFMLVMQFFWKYIDDLMGKGIELSVVVELIFYASAGLIPLALPLAILLSSVMTFGNLSENNELTALKSSGLSLYRIIQPLFALVVVIALFTFYFSNYVIPVANLKWHTIIWDIQNTKIAAVITPGVYNHEFTDYVIKVDEGEDNQFKGIIIHDHSVPNEIKTVRAKSGKLYKAANGKALFFELKDGYVVEELEPVTPKKLPNGTIHRSKKNHPARKSSFKYAQYKILLDGFEMQKTTDDFLKNKHEMLNVFQISHATDSIRGKSRYFLDNFTKSIQSKHPYFNAQSYKNNDQVKVKATVDNGDNKDEKKLEAATGIITFDKLTLQQRKDAVNRARSTIRSINRNLKDQRVFIDNIEKDMDGYMVEFNRKFALTVSIIVLFFIGAPLGAIVGRGGFGAPVIIAALLFMLYYVLISVGDSMAQARTVPPWLGMWFSAFVLAPIAFFVTRAAAKDIPINSGEYWRKLFRRKRS